MYGVVRSNGANELYHWKYIKKNKVNGKWRYYYDWDELKSDVKDATGQTAKEKYQKSAIKEENLRDDYNNAVTRDWSGKISSEEYKNTVGKYKAQNKITNKYRKDYEDSLVGSVDNLKNKASDAIDAGKRWLKSLFN